MDLSREENFNYTLENFGLDPSATRAFTLRGIWNKDDPEVLDFHGFHQVLLTVDGTILIYDREYQYPLFSHVAAFIPAGTPHRVKNDSSRKDVSCMSFFFNRDYFNFPGENISIFEITELGGALIKTLNKEQLVSIVSDFNSRCVELLVEVIKRDLKERPQTIKLPVASDPRIIPATDYIRENYNSKIGLHDISESANFSSRQLTRRFMADIRMSPVEYLRICRILNASVELSGSRNKVIDIALTNGYDSVSNFYSDFRRYFGTSPDKFRKLLNVQSGIIIF